MYACQWHIDIPFGKQKQVVDLLKRWDADMKSQPEMKKVPYEWRLMVGEIGDSPSHIIREFRVENLAGWEEMGKQIGTGRWQKFSDEIAPYIVPGSQHWKVYRIAQ